MKTAETIMFDTEHVIRQTGAKTIERVCEYLDGVRTDAPTHKKYPIYKYTFSDNSVIWKCPEYWDFGYFFCFCPAGTTTHYSDCPFYVKVGFEALVPDDEEKTYEQKPNPL